MRLISIRTVLYCAVALSSGCIIGRVLYTDGTPYVGADVSIRNCDTCSAVGVATDENGYFVYDPYSLPGFPAVPLFVDGDNGIIVTVHENDWQTVSGSTKTCFRTAEIQIAHRTEFLTTVTTSGQEVDYTVLPETHVDRVSTSVDASLPCDDPSVELLLGVYQLLRDIDNDGLPNAVETIHGTTQFLADTDGDGLSDSLELYGMHSAGNAANRTWTVASDIRSRGALPVRKDVFVEITYHQVPDGGSLRPSEILRDALGDLYDGLTGITNPNGSLGINFVVVPDNVGVDLTGVDCQASFTNPTYMSPRRTSVFTHGLYCDLNSTGPEGELLGEAVIGGSQFMVRVPFPDSNETNDLTELTVGVIYAVTLHEVGHTYGILHGGGSEVDCKPLYPSVVNSVFATTFNSPDAFVNLAESNVRYSRGALGGVNENDLDEIAPLPGASFGDVEYLQHFGAIDPPAAPFPIRPNGSTVDINWNRDPVYEEEIDPFNTRIDGSSIDSCQIAPNAFVLVNDFNDIIQIVSSLPSRLPAPPGATASLGEGDYCSADAGYCRPEESYAYISPTSPPSVSPEAAARNEPFSFDVGLALQRMTKLSARSVANQFEEAGIDLQEDAEILAEAVGALRVGRGEPPKGLLSQSMSEAELAKLAEGRIRDAIGRDIEVRFRDCAISIESLKQRLQWLKESPKEWTQPKSYATQSITDLLDGHNELVVCR